MRELISTLKKKKKKAQAGNEWSNGLPKSSHEGEEATTGAHFSAFNNRRQVINALGQSRYSYSDTALLTTML